MRRLLLLLACGSVACSLQRGGTASDVVLDHVDTGIDSSVADTFVAIDTAVPEDSTAPDTTAVDSASDDGPEADVATEADAPATCKAPKAGLDPCTSIPLYEPLATGQILDGKADDFCDLPFVDFDNTKGAIKVPDPVPGGANTVTKIRVAWSSYGLHAHFGVKDDKPLVYAGTDGALFLGDSVEIYLAGTDALTGTYDGSTSDKGAVQIVIAPPDATTPTRATYFYMGAANGSPPSDRWAARVVTGGYEIEVRIPWADLFATGVVAGRKIALTIATNNKYDATKTHAFSTFQVKSPYPTPSTCSGSVQAFCDDRIWCTPTLAP